MTKTDFLVLGALILLALFIWCRDLSWISAADDSLPILVAIPLFIWLGMPWEFRTDPLPISNIWILGMIFFITGIGLNFTFFLALGWTIILWAWLSSRIEPKFHNSLKKLMILPLMAFPWVTLDAERVGWWFRLSGAWATAQVFSHTGFQVVQEGTSMTINKLPISVEVACSGLNTLQSILIAGSVANYIILGDSIRYWMNIPMLIAISWLANTLRIIFLSIVALAISPQFAMSSFHIWGGWVILIVMFALCWLILTLQQPNKTSLHK
jgi:exosortase/archaeosortase family protein